MSDVLDKIKHYSKTLEEADFLPTVFGDYLSEAVNHKCPVVLYGAGSAGKELFECLQMHKVNVVCFCDQNEDLIGTTLFDIPVISFDALKVLHKDSIIIIASNNYKNEIKNKLKKYKFSRIACVNNDEQFFYYLQFYKWRYELDELLINLERISLAYDCFSDEKSKLLFIKRIALLTSYADYYLFNQYIIEFGDQVNIAKRSDFKVSEYTENFESYLYFNNDVLNLSDGDVLLDAGAFDGDSAIEFISACHRNRVNYQHVYCVEADVDNYKKLKKNTKAYDRLTCISIGLWSKSAKLRFATSKSMFISEARIVDGIIEMNNNQQNVQDGDEYIDAVSIDNKFSDKKISFIKMDIEGSEVEAIKGARKTIKKYKPKLAISVYHKKTDIYEIPLLIQEICPEYKFYLRHFSTHLSETVLLAKI